MKYKNVRHSTDAIVIPEGAIGERSLAEVKWREGGGKEEEEWICLVWKGRRC